MSRVGFRWRGALDQARLLLGDAWERGYGDLEWRGMVPDRVMPWYVMAWGRRTHRRLRRTHRGRGTLLLASRCRRNDTLGRRAKRRNSRASRRSHAECVRGDLPSGPRRRIGVCCGRSILPADVRQSRLPSQPAYGSNDWYWAYGDNSTASVLGDAQRIADVSPTGSNRPFIVIDDGWQPGRGKSTSGAGTWDRGNEKFPDIPALVSDVRRTGGRLGAWIRPLEAAADVPDSWRLPRDRATLDPTVARRAREDRRGYLAPARLGDGADQARLHVVRPVRPLGEPDGIGADARWLDLRGRAATHHGRSDQRDVRDHSLSRGRRAGDWMQYNESSVSRCVRTLPDW